MSEYICHAAAKTYFQSNMQSRWKQIWVISCWKLMLIEVGKIAIQPFGLSQWVSLNMKGGRSLSPNSGIAYWSICCADRWDKSPVFIYNLLLQSQTCCSTQANSPEDWILKHAEHVTCWKTSTNAQLDIGWLLRTKWKYKVRENYENKIWNGRRLWDFLFWKRLKQPFCPFSECLECLSYLLVFTYVDNKIFKAGHLFKLRSLLMCCPV